MFHETDREVEREIQEVRICLRKKVIRLPRVRTLGKKYEISKHRFYELYHYCMQYKEWKEELQKLHQRTTAAVSDMPKGTSDKNQLEELAIKRTELQAKIDSMQKAAVQADPELATYILRAVTEEDITYDFLRNRCGMPSGKDKYYEARRRFYWFMDKIVK